MKQPMMMRILYALIPVMLGGIYFFGWRVLVLVAVCSLAGVLVEWLMSSRRGEPISVACFVTCWLYALSLPPTMPLWMAAVGVIIGVIFGKEVFGGFGRNFANPAIVGRVFVYVAFPIEMTGSFVPAFRDWPGGFGQWSLASMSELPTWLKESGHKVGDAITAATPMWVRRDFGADTPLENLFLGNIGGTFQSESGSRVLAAGSIGEVSALLIILAGVYLLITRTANWRLMVSPLLGAGLVCLGLRLAGIEQVPPLGFTLLSGALLYGSIFMVTEPISGPRKHLAMWIYGLLIGALIVVLRWRAQFAGAVGFAILLGNICSPSLDKLVGSWSAKNQPQSEAAAAEKG